MTRIPTKRCVPTRLHLGIALACTVLASLCPAPALAGDRLPATMGVIEVEGSAGGGLTPWATIAGAGSRDQVGVAAFATDLRTNGSYSLAAEGVAVGVFDTVEVSLSQLRFGLADTVPGQSIRLQTTGVKVRLFGDAVYDQDRWWPQVSAGVQHKHSLDPAVPLALGARRTTDNDWYVAATKVWLGAAAGRNVVADLTLRETRANQFGILGFGGQQNDGYRLEPEVSLAILPRDDIATGFEWRERPNQLTGLREQAAADAFVAWFPLRWVSLTAAYLDLGNVAVKPGQRAWYASAVVQF